jgi:trehalose/maltose transport system substrate-binding protein
MKKWRGVTRVASLVLALVLSPSVGCSRQSPDPIRLTFLDPEWVRIILMESNVLPDEKWKAFTQKTGIVVKHLPTPETTLDQLDLVRGLLRGGPPSPDVYGIDVIWTDSLSEDLIDLKPNFTTELPAVDPDEVASYTVKGKLVALPYHSDVGVLFYRKDLLQEYGYKSPPSTWVQLEKMAERIQNGERGKGRRDFWGFIWPGAAGEGLTCNALEWQVSEGGGHIIEDDKSISVNNPDAIRTWQRAAHWIGWISPPDLLSYEEWEAINAFYSKKAAFYRGWTRNYFQSVEDDPAIRNTYAVTSIPAGKDGQFTTRGGYGLGVSRAAPHPVEAMELVRFLFRIDSQLRNTASQSESRERPDPYEPPTRSNPGSGFTSKWELPKGTRVVSRPSVTTGQKYEDVSRAYVQAVHSVLLRKTSAPEAAAALEKELVRITGFKTGPPSRIRAPKGEEHSTGGS